MLVGEKFAVSPDGCPETVTFTADLKVEVMVVVAVIVALFPKGIVTEPADVANANVAGTETTRLTAAFLEVPPEVAKLPVIGSRVFPYDGRTVALAIIDKRDGTLLFEFHASEFAVQLPPDGDWLIMTKENWVGAIRQRGDHCFLLAFRGGKADMREFLESLRKK